MQNSREKELSNAAKRIAAIFAFVAIIAIGIFGSLALASTVPNVFSGMASAVGLVFGGDTENSEEENIPVPGDQSLSLTAPQTIEDGQTFTLSWGHTGKTQNGTYAVRYDCVDGVTFTSPTFGDITCGNAFNLEGVVGSIALTANATVEPSSNVALYIDFIPEGASEASVSGSLSVDITYTAPETDDGTNTEGTGGGSTTVQIPVSDPNGFTDLTVRFVSVGVVDRNTGTFFPSVTPSRSNPTQRIAVRFEVKNIGTKTSPAWFFRATLPSGNGQTFNSQVQQALQPNESIIYTLAFDGFTSASQGTVSITVDQNSYIIESNETNNVASQIINTAP